MICSFKIRAAGSLGKCAQQFIKRKYMKIVKSSAEMKNLSLTYQTSGRTVSLVPTMGHCTRGTFHCLK